MSTDSTCRVTNVLTLLLLALVGSVPAAVGQEPTTVGSNAESPVVAPFLSRALVESILEDLARERVDEERVSSVYLDPDSGLLWATKDNGRDIDWYRAATYCENLDLAGFSDWGLPSLEDLETLLRPMAQGAYNLPGKFTLTACCPWSSTTKNEQSAWNFNFQFSKPFSGSFSYTYDHRALCRRLPLEEERALIEALQKEARKKKVPKK